jgi:serine protease Do
VYQGIETVDFDFENDFALLKVTTSKGAGAVGLNQETPLPHIEISTRSLVEGEPVYSYGYPLPQMMSSPHPPPLELAANLLPADFRPEQANLGFSVVAASPRVTSAVIAAVEYLGQDPPPSEPMRYVIDKALNYGNSGGPVIAAETGKVFAVCNSYQPVLIPQDHLKPTPPPVKIPSLYGVVSSLSNTPIQEILRRHGVAISTE